VKVPDSPLRRQAAAAPQRQLTVALVTSLPGPARAQPARTVTRTASLPPVARTAAAVGLGV
jgi:hypothetical protein